MGESMSITLALYFIEILNNVSCIASIIFFTSLVLFLICIGCESVLRNDVPKEEDFELSKLLIKKWKLSLFLLVLLMIIPCKSTMYLMLGTNYLDNSELPSKVKEALTLKIDNIISELKDSKDKK